MLFLKQMQMLVKFINKNNSNCVNQHLPIYDASLWTYSNLFEKSMFWKRICVCCKIHHKNKTIECLGGIEWGLNYIS